MLKEGNYNHYKYQLKCQKSPGNPEHRKFYANYYKNAFSRKSDYVNQSKQWCCKLSLCQIESLGVGILGYCI